jgi:alpha-D-ribose 1-methylphosphonate 5-triphosphate synthase subunit PhnG
MLQQVDNAERARWMGLLSRAPLAMLEASAALRRAPAYLWLRRPESGLAMVRARAGGTGAQFNLGEMTLTRCVLRLESGELGIAYVQGRSHRKAELAALADALLQSPESREGVRRELIAPLQARLEAEAKRAHERTQSTRVEFFTVSRETSE